MDMGRTRDGVLAVADLADDRALRDHAAGRDDGRAELEQRDRVAVGGQDRDRAAAARHRTGEGDGSCGRGAHRRADSRTDVDAAVLAGGVAVLGEGERLAGPARRPARSKPAATGMTIRDAIAAATATESMRRIEYRLRDVEGNCVHASGAFQRLFNDSA